LGNRLYIYADGYTSDTEDSTWGQGGLNIANQTGTPLATLVITAGKYLSPRLQQTPHTSVPAYKISDLT
jgi:hypothetical protein